jgi:hypothetical protein
MTAENQRSRCALARFPSHGAKNLETHDKFPSSWAPLPGTGAALDLHGQLSGFLSVILALGGGRAGLAEDVPI